MRICVVIPVHNEEQAIGRVVATLRAKNLEVLVVDDGSADKSAAIAAMQGALVFQNSVRQGKGKTLQRGFREAVQRGYDGVITMDGDGQHDPQDLEKFWPRISATPGSVIVGSRMDNAQGMPLVRYLTNRFMSWIISLVCHQRIADTQCGYRYISAEILRQLSLTANDFEIETEVLIKASKKGYKIFSVPVKTIYGDEESKISPWKDTVRFFKYLWRELRQPRTGDKG